MAVGQDPVQGLQGAVWTSDNGIDWTRVHPADTQLFGQGRSFPIEWVLFYDVEVTPSGVVVVGQAETFSRLQASHPRRRRRRLVL